MLNIPQKINDVYNRIVADFKAYNPLSQPAVKNSWIGSILVAISGRIYDIYRKLNFIIKQAFIDTATGEYLKRWGSYVNIYQKAATKASGKFILTGTAGSIIPKDTEILVGSNVYKTNNSVQVANTTVEISDYSKTLDLVTITFANERNLGTGMTISINGEDYIVQVLDANKISVTTEEDWSGPLTIVYNSTIVDATPNEAGLSYNIPSGTTGKTSSVIQGVDVTCYTNYAGFTGGSDIESIESLRKRIIYRYQNPVTNFNKSAIIAFMQSLPNIGEVVVHEITPKVGQVTIYYLLRNNEEPTSGKTESVLNSIDTDLRPANTDISDIFLSAASPVVVDIDIDNIYPLSVKLKDSVKESLKQYFMTLKLETKVYRNDLIEIIKGSIDTETGQGVVSFDLVTPAEDIEVGVGKFAKLGDIDI